MNAPRCQCPDCDCRMEVAGQIEDRCSACRAGCHRKPEEQPSDWQALAEREQAIQREEKR